MTETPFVVRKFDKALHDRGAFCCGVEELDRWIKQSASSMVKDGKAAVYCLFVRDEWDAAQAQKRKARVIGYYGICAHSIAPADAASLGARFAHPIPAAYLTTIAIDHTMQGQQLGAMLTVDAIEKCIALSDALGIAAIVLDVRQDDNYERRLKFYQGLGFRLLNPDHDSKRVVLTIKDAKASLG